MIKKSIRSLASLLVVFVVTSLAPSAFAGEWRKAKFTGTEILREYSLYIPSVAKASGPRPLVLALHGCKQTPEDFSKLARLEELAEARGVYLLMPRQTRLINFSQCWNWFLPSNQERDSGEPGVAIEMLEWVKQHHAIDSKRIYVMGVSAGGGLTSTLLALYPEVFAAGMVGSGTMFGAADGMIVGFKVSRSGSANDPAKVAHAAWEKARGKVRLPKRLPVLVFHGDADRACNSKNGTQVTEQFLKFNDLLDDEVENGSVGRAPVVIEALRVPVPEGYEYTYSGFGSDRDHVVVESYVVHGMGHSWSGGADEPFNDPRGPSESAIAWDFFARHHK